MTTLERKHYQFKVKDPMSALTHFLGFIFAIIGMPTLLIKASVYQNNLVSLISYAIFMISMIILYGASSAYHSFNVNDNFNAILKRIDHMSIFILIAGSYTPICLVALRDSVGIKLLIAIWMIAIGGMILKFFYVFCPKWFSSLIYCLMGWLCISVLPELLKYLPTNSFYWLLAGGLFYTIGSIIYAIKPKFLTNEFFGNHELFHCFVLAGSLCHFVVVFHYLVIIG